MWRRLRALGAAGTKDGVYVLPGREECVEAFQWLAQEVEEEGGSALVMRVERFEGLADAKVIDLFQRARSRDYVDLERQTAELERALTRAKRGRGEDLSRVRGRVEQLRRHHADISRIDYFENPAGGRVAARLVRIGRLLAPARAAEVKIPTVALGDYRDKRWVTRPHPHVDRLACAWLIRRFVNPRAVIRYADVPAPGEVAFDMSHGDFGHRGNLCTFETMMRAFSLDDGGLRGIAEIVHDIDLRDGRYARPETAGIDAVLKGWTGLPDAECETRGVALFEGLYTALSKPARRTAPARRKHRGGST